MLVLAVLYCLVAADDQPAAKYLGTMVFVPTSVLGPGDWSGLVPGDEPNTLVSKGSIHAKTRGPIQEVAWQFEHADLKPEKRLKAFAAYLDTPGVVVIRWRAVMKSATHLPNGYWQVEFEVHGSFAARGDDATLMATGSMIETWDYNPANKRFRLLEIAPGDRMAPIYRLPPPPPANRAIKVPEPSPKKAQRKALPQR